MRQMAFSRTQVLQFFMPAFALLAIAVLSQSMGKPIPPIGASLILFAGLTLLSAIDLHAYRLPDWLTLPLIGVGLLYTYLAGEALFWSAGGAVLGYGVLWALAEYWRRVKKREGMGLGDAKLLAAGGAWLGAASLPVILLIASATGLLYAGFRAMRGQSAPTASQMIAFGPFLAIGIWSAWCFALGL